LQGGSILTFKSAYSSKWSRFALAFNYRIKSDYDSFYKVEGNSNYLFNNEHFNDVNTPKTQFDSSISQSFTAENRGQSSVFNLGFSAVYEDKLFVGGTLNVHDLDFNRTVFLEENNEDASQNILQAQNYIRSHIRGAGFSLSLGFIYKFNQKIRLGLAYETPTWYQEITEQYDNELALGAISALGINRGVDVINDFYVYRFRTYSRVTASAAYVFGKKGLLSFDYTYKDYPNIKYRENDEVFIETNTFFKTQYRGTHRFNIGTEWRFKDMRIRGGDHYEKNPNLLASLGGSINEDNIRGLSLGLGYVFENMNIDISYSKFKNKQFETLYNLGDIAITNNTSRVLGTLTIKL
jgi:long-subunit fatty acid transport protein